MTGTEHPLVSVIIPYYNGRKHIKQAVQSILGQTYKNIEIVVVNDASCDKQDSGYIENLSRGIGFKLITHTINKGIGQTLADAVDASSGEYIAELSQDDFYKPEKIERQMKDMVSKNLHAVYAVGDILYSESKKTVTRNIAKTKKSIESGAALEMLRLQNLSCISMQGLLAKRSVFDRDIVPIWRDYLLDDWPVNIRLFERYKVGFIDVPLWTGRVHTQNTSRDRWKWLGPQIEVAARMAPEELKAEGIGGRLGSMARRLRKQNGDQNAIISFALAALMLADSPDQHKKVSRVLNKVPSKHKKAIAISKCRLFESIVWCQQEINLPNKTGNINWHNLGKEIANVISDYQGSDRLNEISRCFLSLVYSILSDNRSATDCAVRFALAALMLTDDEQEKLEIAEILQTVPPEYRRLIRKKHRLIKAKSRRSLIPSQVNKCALYVSHFRGFRAITGWKFLQGFCWWRKN